MVLIKNFIKFAQTVLDFKTKYNLTYNVGSYPKGFKDGISIEANVSGIILAFATNPVIGAQILYIYESILKEVETASNNDYYGSGGFLASWNSSWFGAHPTNGISGKAIQNADNKPVKTKFKIELYKSEDVGNDTKFEK